MIPLEYLWYIIGAASVHVSIKIYLRALTHNREVKPLLDAFLPLFPLHKLL